MQTTSVNSTFNPAFQQNLFSLSHPPTGSYTHLKLLLKDSVHNTITVHHDTNQCGHNIAAWITLAILSLPYSIRVGHRDSPVCENKGRPPTLAMSFKSISITGAISRGYALSLAVISALSTAFISFCICGNHKTTPGHASVLAASSKYFLIMFT